MSPSLTADGSEVAFTARNNDLVANDTNGVSDVFRAAVTRGDDVSPALSLPQFPISVPADRPADAVVTYTVTATDTGDPNPMWSCSPASGSVFPIGDTTVTCTATDESGNVSTGSFSVHVQGRHVRHGWQGSARPAGQARCRSLDVDEQFGELKSIFALDTGRTKAACSVLQDSSTK